VNALSAARLFLFGARDVWFVVALPVFLSSALGWDHWRVGAFLAAWVIGYGMVQALAPRLTGRTSPGRGRVIAWAAVLALAPAALALALADGRWPAAPVLVAGLTAFGVLFAVNSAVHSYLIVRHAQADGVSLDVGFYYMANAMGRLLGTVLSGWLYQAQGLVACLWVSALLVALSALAAGALPRQPAPSSAGHAAPP
jgi:predicted MFS family arabinose efflux permease